MTSVPASRQERMQRDDLDHGARLRDPRTRNQRRTTLWRQCSASPAAPASYPPWAAEAPDHGRHSARRRLLSRARRRPRRRGRHPHPHGRRAAAAPAPTASNPRLAANGRILEFGTTERCFNRAQRRRAGRPRRRLRHLWTPCRRDRGASRRALGRRQPHPRRQRSAAVLVPPPHHRCPRRLACAHDRRKPRDHAPTRPRPTSMATGPTIPSPTSRRTPTTDAPPELSPDTGTPRPRSRRPAPGAGRVTPAPAR